MLLATRLHYVHDTHTCMLRALVTVLVTVLEEVINVY